MRRHTDIADHKIKRLSGFFLAVYPSLVIDCSDESNVAPPTNPIQAKSKHIDLLHRQQYQQEAVSTRNMHRSINTQQLWNKTYQSGT